MQTSGISTRALFEGNRSAVRNLSEALSRAQTETTTGRLADAGETLGARSGETFSFRQDIARLGAIRDSNSVAATRLEASQEALTNITKVAQDFVSALISARDSSGNQVFLPEQALANVAGLTDAMNASNGGAYLFGGLNTEQKPLAAYSTGSAPRTAVEAAFQTAFGFPQSDTAAATITPAQMQTFLDGGFAALFTEPNWRAAWSSAESVNLTSRIAPDETATTSANANEAAVRSLMSAYVMVADLGAQNLSPDTFKTVIDNAVRLAGEAIQGVTTVQAALGIAQERIAGANERMERQASVMADYLDGLEGVDPFEAASRVTELTTRLETAYALTARLERLSLLNYL